MDCSIIIPSYNGRAVLEPCLRALFEQTSTAPIAREILVVDNGSSDDTRLMLAQEFPAVQIIALPKNTGFTGGIAGGVSQARGDVLVFLNNDTRPDFTWLDTLLGPLRDPKIAATGSVMLDADEEKIDFGGGTANLFGWGFQKGHGESAYSLPTTTEPIPSLFVCGGAMAVRRALYNTLGGFDNDYFAFFEDVDLGWRLNLAGHQVMLVPESRVAHQQSHTAKTMPKSLRTFLVERNALTTMIKNLSDNNLNRLLPWAFGMNLERALLDLGIERDRLFAGRWGDEIFGRGSKATTATIAEGVAQMGDAGKRIVKETILGEGNAIERGQARLLATQSVMRRWLYWMQRRATVQATRTVGDLQLFPLLHDLLRPPLGHPYEQALMDQLGALLKGDA